MSLEICDSSALASLPVIESPAPVIYTRIVAPPPLTIMNRLSAGVIGCGCLMVLLLAAWLQPSAKGFGTHTQLGLRECAWKAQTGYPCPGCGMTTSFSYFAHGNVVASFYTQPMGFVLAVLTAMAVWIGFYIALSGRPVHRLFRFIPSRYYLMPMLIFALLAWGWKILLTVQGLDGWK